MGASQRPGCSPSSARWQRGTVRVPFVTGLCRSRTPLPNRRGEKGWALQAGAASSLCASLALQVQKHKRSIVAALEREMRNVDHPEVAAESMLALAEILAKQTAKGLGGAFRRIARSTRKFLDAVSEPTFLPLVRGAWGGQGPARAAWRCSSRQPAAVAPLSLLRVGRTEGPGTQVPFLRDGTRKGPSTWQGRGRDEVTSFWSWFPKRHCQQRCARSPSVVSP